MEARYTVRPDIPAPTLISLPTLRKIAVHFVYGCLSATYVRMAKLVTTSMASSGLAFVLGIVPFDRLFQSYYKCST